MSDEPSLQARSAPYAAGFLLWTAGLFPIAGHDRRAVRWNASLTSSAGPGPAAIRLGRCAAEPISINEDPRRFDYGFARFGFSDLYLVLHLDKNELLVNSHNVFNDGSRRDRRSVATFKRTNDSRSVRGKSERDKLLNSLR
jgi:hypothetical protein